MTDNQQRRIPMKDVEERIAMYRAIRQEKMDREIDDIVLVGVVSFGLLAAFGCTMIVVAIATTIMGG